MSYLLDTNVISELVARQPEAAVLAYVGRLDPESVYLSAITVGEIKRGIEKLPSSERRSRLQSWIHEDLPIRFQGHILPIDVEVMLCWGNLVSRLSKAGRILPAMDSLIAAQALYHKCVLVTRSAADFEDTGASVFNPWR